MQPWRSPPNSPPDSNETASGEPGAVHYRYQGVALMTGDRVVFTRGPMKGMRFKRVGSATLLWLDEQGNPGRIRCARGGAAAR